MSAFDPTAYLPDDLVARIRSRAEAYDRDNRFADEDLDDLRAAGYLTLAVPTDRGGAGLGLAELAVLQQRLATAAPATAVAINMHLVWTAVAASLVAQGIEDFDTVLDDAAAGELLAFGISEPGNDLVLFDSRTDAVPIADGGYAFTGTKVFTSLAPVWTRLGVHGLDTSDPDAPALVFAFLTRGDGVVTRDDWHALGMRASQSRTTELHAAVAPAARIVRRITPGPNLDPLTIAIFAAFEILVAAVYTGIAERALGLAVDAAHARRSLSTGRADADDPGIRGRIAAMGIAFDALPPQVLALARDADALHLHGPRWFSLLSGLKHRAVTTAKDVVDAALVVAGGASYADNAELARLYRDVAAGAFHPSDAESALAASATAWLGPVSD